RLQIQRPFQQFTGPGTTLFLQRLDMQGGILRGGSQKMGFALRLKKSAARLLGGKNLNAGFNRRPHRSILISNMIELLTTLVQFAGEAEQLKEKESRADVLRRILQAFLYLPDSE